MKYITNVKSDKYGRIMSWIDLPSENEAGQAIDYSGNETAIRLPEDEETNFYKYCGKKSKVTDKAVVTDMTLPEWKSKIVLENESAVTLTDIQLALCEIYESIGGINNG